jgi:hypothetical protein
MTLQDLINLGSMIGLLLTALGLFLSVQQFKLNRTMQYMEYLSKPELIEIRASVEEWLMFSSDDEARIKLLENNHKLHSQVRVFVSFCTQISTAYRFGAIHKKMAFDIWVPFIPTYWERLKFYMIWRTAQGYEIGGNFEKFTKEINKYYAKKNSATTRRRIG